MLWMVQSWMAENYEYRWHDMAGPLNHTEGVRQGDMAVVVVVVEGTGEGHILGLVHGQDLEVEEVVDILGVGAGHMTANLAVGVEVVLEAGQSQIGQADLQGRIQEHRKKILKIMQTEPVF